MAGSPGASLPSVSVVIPTRSRPHLVTRAVTSALAQSMTDIEVIVVVDGPDEDARASLASVTDRRLRVVELAQPGGAPNARNVGVGQARAPWTAFLDDDDEWLEHKLAVQLDLAHDARAPMPIVATRLFNRTPRAELVMPRRLPEPGEPLCDYLTVRRGLFHGEGFIQTSTIMAPTALPRRVPFTVGLGDPVVLRVLVHRRTLADPWECTCVLTRNSVASLWHDPVVLRSATSPESQIYSRFWQELAGRCQLVRAGLD